MAACDADGKALPPEVGLKFFSLRGAVLDDIPHSPPAVLKEIRDRLQAEKLDDLKMRNEAFFGEEEEKLDRWAEDRKFALEHALRNLDIEIKGVKKASRSAVTLADKLEAQKQIKSLELKRSVKRRELFTEQDNVDQKRAELIERMEQQLELKIYCETLFTLRWELVSTNREGSVTG